MNTILALDGGFGNTKIAYKNGDGHIHVESFPSVVGLGQTDMGLLTTGLDGRRRQVKPFVVEFDGLQYLAGPNIHRWNRPVERLDFRRLYEGPEARTLFYAALASIGCEVQGGRVTLVGAVPTYHLKQLAQVFAKRVAGVGLIQNRIAVLR